MGASSTSSGSTLDVLSAASGQSSSGGSSSVSDTTTVSAFYVEASLPILFVSRFSNVFLGLRPSVLVVPRIAYSGADAQTWLTYGVHAELGVRF